MTDDSAFKKQVRARMAETGEKYTTARRMVITGRDLGRPPVVLRVYLNPQVDLELTDQLARAYAAAGEPGRRDMANRLLADHIEMAVALLATGDGVAAVDADLRDPAAVLGHRDLRAVIDPGRPVCVILGAVLHFLDPDAACAVTAGYVSLMAPGSCLVVSCARFEDEELAKQLAQEYTAATWYNHSPADITEFFDGLELAGPGVTEARTWPKRPPAAGDRNGHVLAGVGRVPGMR